MNSNYDLFYDRAFWYLKFAWLPHYCCKTGKRIWFKRAYKGTAMYTGPGTPVFEHRWIVKEQYLLCKLKGEV